MVEDIYVIPTRHSCLGPTLTENDSTFGREKDFTMSSPHGKPAGYQTQWSQSNLKEILTSVRCAYCKGQLVGCRKEAENNPDLLQDRVDNIDN